MKNILYLKFLTAYMLLGLAGFILISTLGSNMIENRLVDSESTALYKAANAVASSHAAKYYTRQTSLEDIYLNLVSLSSYQNSRIWMLSKQGEILLDTAVPLETQAAAKIKGFDPASFSNTYYAVGDFYGQFEDNTLSVLVPISLNMSTKGYIAIHESMSKVYLRREQLLLPMYLISILFFLLSTGILLLFSHIVYRPLKKITAGAAEFASGNLKYNIPVSKEDEMGYLAATLNYMSDELDKTGDYQRKFIANVSHDFRSPLTSIKGYAEAILDGTIPSEMQEKYLKIVVFESERLNKLTRSLLTLNDMNDKGQILDITDFDINGVIKNTAAAFEGICRDKKISIELILAAEKPFVSADVGRIQQVLYNLIDNAIKFSSRNSSITLETTEKQNIVFVSVKDFGTGIPKNSITKIWDRFYKTDPSRGKDRKGTGLGLSIVKEIINAHHQHINVLSTEGVGTEFLFTLEKAKHKT